MQILQSGKIIVSDDNATQRREGQTGTCSKRIDNPKDLYHYENLFLKASALKGILCFDCNEREKVTKTSIKNYDNNDTDEIF